MTSHAEDLNLNDRLTLIEAMIAEGRRSTQQWSWVFLLWGVAYYVAIAWSVWGRSALAWPVTMIAAALATGIGRSRVRRDHPSTTIGRAMGAIWGVMGTVLFVVLMAVGSSGRAELHTFVVIAGAMLAVANGISGILLRWKMQLACALAWLALTVAACFTTDAQIAILSLAAIFFCQIVFGVYAMVLEARRRRQQGAVHA